MTADESTPTPLETAPHVLIVHGFGATPEDHWFPWLARTLPRAERITLPDPLTPEADRWVPQVAEALERLGDGTAVVAHSLGNATSLQALRTLAAEGRPVRLSAFVGVAPFVSPVPPTGDPELDAFLVGHDGAAPAQHAFFAGLDLPALRPQLGAVRVLRSNDDPIVPARLSDEVAAALGVQTELVAGAGHFLASDGLVQLPVLLDGAGPDDAAAPHRTAPGAAARDGTAPDDTARDGACPDSAMGGR